MTAIALYGPRGLASMFRTLLMIAIGVCVGALTATQPLILIAVIVLIIALVVSSAITPLAPLAFMLILAPLRTLIATESAFQLPLDIGQLLLMLFIASWLLHLVVIQRKLPYVEWSPLYGALAVFIFSSALSAFNAWQISAWLPEWLKWLQMILLIALILALKPRKEWLVAILAAAAAANAIVGLYEFFGGSGALHLLVNGRFFRAFGTFGQPNPFGGFMGLIAPLVLTSGSAYLWRWWRNRRLADLVFGMVYTFISALLLAGVVVSWSRGSWLAVVAAFIVASFAFPRRLGNGLLIAGGIGVLVLMLWWSGLLPQSIVSRVSSSTSEFFTFSDVRGVDITPLNYAVVERLAHWQAALNMTREHFWFGVGFGNYEVAYPAYRLINWDEPLGHAHNYYLNILAETGFIGFVSYSMMWLAILWLTWRLRQHPDVLSRFIALGLLAGWTYLLVHSVFDNLFVNNLFLHLGVMLALLGLLYPQVGSTIRMRVS